MKGQEREGTRKEGEGREGRIRNVGTCCVSNTASNILYFRTLTLESGTFSAYSSDYWTLRLISCFQIK